MGVGLFVSVTVDTISSGSGTNVSHSRKSCSVAPLVGETVDVDLSEGRRVVETPFTDGSVGILLSVGETVDAVSPMGGIVGAYWENKN